MTRRHKNSMTNRVLPATWLMTDPRLDDGMLRAIQRLPCGSGVIFRHYNLDNHARRALFNAVRIICRRRGHMILLAGDIRTAKAWGADGVHGNGNAHPYGAMIQSAPVHNFREIAKARRNKADMMLLSPCFATATHPGVRPLGAMRFRQLSSLCGKAKVIALGGMTRPRAMMMDARIVYGWAGIDAFLL
jgi:thiamine-phosphate pyrophosphorylase